MKAAFIKCAVEEHGLVGDVPRIVAAAAAAHVETGAPVMVHTNAAARVGAGRARGADRGRGRARRSSWSPTSATRTTSTTSAGSPTRGAYLGWDRFNIEHFNPDAERIETLMRVLEEGYVDQIHFSHDGATFHDFMVGDPRSPTSTPTTCTSRT